MTHSVIELCGSSTQLNDAMVKGENLKIAIFQVYVDTVGDPEKYRIKLSERFPAIKFVVAKKADSLFPVVSGASIVAKVVNSPFSTSLPIYFIQTTSNFIFHSTLQVTRDRALREWVLDETADNMHRNFGSGYPGGEKSFILFLTCQFVHIGC